MKILDFGLAKLRDPDANARGPEDATRRAMTGTGVVMGTAGYMSPEQVRGHATDHRSDIFSFGLILYEMITGRRAFQEASLAETMSAIAKEEPAEITASNPNVNPSLERIVRRCLEKRPERRFQSASDLGLALESLSAMTSSSGSGVQTIAAEPEPGRQIRRPWLFGLGALLLVAGAAAGILGYSYVRRPTMPSYEQLTFRRGFVGHARFTPDGQSVVYSAAWSGNPSEIYTTRSGMNESRSLGLTNADLLSISSTGGLAVLIKRTFLYQLSYRGTLARMPMIGGTPREILEDVVEAEWSPDGTELAVVRVAGGRFRLEYPIGKVLYETEGYVSHPRMSPKGDRIAFVDHQVAGDNRGRVAIVNLAGETTFLSGGSAAQEGLAWSPGGDEVWFTASYSGDANAVYAATPAGATRLVLKVPAELWIHDISRDGRALLTRYKQTTDVVRMAAGETRERDLSWLDAGGLRDLSADGQHFVFEHWGQGSGTNYATYLGKADGSPAVRLGEDSGGPLSPDGRTMLGITLDSQQVYFLPTGAGELQRLQKGRIEKYGTAFWMPDSKQVVFTGREPGRKERCHTQVIGSPEPKPITAEGIRCFMVSPDGKWVLGVDTNAETATRAIYPVGGDEQPRPIQGLADGERILRWSADGRSPYVRSGEELPIRITRLEVATGRREAVREVMPADRAGLFYPPEVLISVDGKSYIYTARRYLMDLYLVDGLQ